MGRLASVVAKTLLNGQREGRDDRVLIVNAEHAIVTGARKRVLATYQAKYDLNHPRKGPFFPRMPDLILKRTVRGMLPYQKNTTGRTALKNLRVEIGTPRNISKELPTGMEWFESPSLKRDLPERFVRLGEISKVLGAPAERWESIGGEA